MPDEHFFDGEWENVNSDLRRVKVPGGWLVVGTVKILVAGKDYHVTSQPVLVSDPFYDWVIKK